MINSNGIEKYLCGMQYAEHEYIPGICNIGRQEIARRYRTAYVGLVLCGILIVLLEAVHVHSSWRLILFFPAVLIFSGFLQARQRFCLAYGWWGVFSVKGYRKTTRVAEPEFLRADRRMAVMLTAKVVAGAILITGCYYLIGKVLD